MSDTFVGMPPASNFTVKGDKLSDTNLAHPLGDKVDNSVGTNLADGRANGKSIATSRGSTGHSFNSYAKPSWLCH